MLKRRILFVISSVDRIEGTGQPTGAWLEELAAPYYTFVDAGHDPIIASIKGGSAAIDPLSLQAPWLSPFGQRFNVDEGAKRRSLQTVELASVGAKEVDVVYAVGGVAAAWDFPDCEDLTRIVTEVNARGNCVAGVCHGVLGLTGAKSATGRPLVEGRAVTGVSNAEEVLTGFDKIVPVMPENRLLELGARYSCAAPFERHVVRDGNLMTGQNPASAGPLAEAILQSWRSQ
jgi:putative intracellular protease/amidase